MKNPWLDISHLDYENHMTEVGQAQTLNKLTKYWLDKYTPTNFALIGCCTGNGLEHLNPKHTKNVYAIDINPDYLNQLEKKFASAPYQLQTFAADIQNDKIEIQNIDLIVTGLVLEYVEPLQALSNLIALLAKKGKLCIVIQKSKQTTFVSKTKYKSLEKLASISREVNEEKIDQFIRSENLNLLQREEIELTKNKSFIILEYQINK